MLPTIQVPEYDPSATDLNETEWNALWREAKPVFDHDLQRRRQRKLKRLGNAARVSVRHPHRNGTSRERRPGSTRRRRSSSRTGSRAGPSDPDSDEPPRVEYPRLTPDLRRWLRHEVDRRRREVIEARRQLDRELFAEERAK